MKIYIFKFALLLLVLTTVATKAAPADSLPVIKHSLFVGFRFQKAAGFYWTNGLSVEYSTTKIGNKKISFGLNFVSSKLGSALASNAIPYFEINGSAIKYFRNEKKLKPLVRLNIGYAHANYGSEIFNSIPNQSMLLSVETGASYDFKIPVRVALAGGYNIITGNGIKGLGVLFPVYAQCSVFYTIKVK